eukprot:11909517-Alexandrium_andersonii.AAC.1
MPEAAKASAQCRQKQQQAVSNWLDPLFDLSRPALGASRVRKSAKRNAPACSNALALGGGGLRRGRARCGGCGRLRSRRAHERGPHTFELD